MPEAVVLVTGGAGFIGSELVRQLLARGRRVIAVDNLTNGKRENLAGLDPERLTLAEADVRDAAAMRELLRGAERVYHLACLGVRHSIHSPAENHEVNATATLQLLALAREARVARFVQVSSSEVYGTARCAPMSEEHPTFPHTVYGAAKLAGEGYARACWLTYGYPTVIVRPFNSYGPRSHHEGDSGEVIPRFLLRALAGRPLVVFGDGEQTRDFSYVSDTAAGILQAGEQDAARGETVNLGAGAEVSINALAGVVGEVVGRAVKVEHAAARPGDVRRLIADASRARRILGFTPRVGLAEGLGRLLEWYRSLGRTPEDLLEAEQTRSWERGAWAEPGGTPGARGRER